MNKMWRSKRITVGQLREIIKLLESGLDDVVERKDLENNDTISGLELLQGVISACSSHTWAIDQTVLLGQMLPVKEDRMEILYP